MEWQRFAAVRDSPESYALLLRTCNPSMRCRKRASRCDDGKGHHGAMSVLRMATPNLTASRKGLSGNRELGKDGYLGLKVPSLSPKTSPAIHLARREIITSLLPMR